MPLESAMLLRLWWTLAAARLKPRLGLLDECVTPLRVWPNDLDINLHLTNNRYLRAMDLNPVMNTHAG